MICEVRDNEVIIHNPKLSDIFALIYCMIKKDRVIAFTKPEDNND